MGFSRKEMPIKEERRSSKGIIPFAWITSTRPANPPQFTLISHNRYKMQLPLEILAEIACIYPAEIWAFASVCRHWRYATMVHSKCWNCIHIRQTEEIDLHNGLEYRLKLWAERGGEAPLELLLQGPFHRFVFSDPFLGSIFRIRTLHIDAWPFEYDATLQPIVFPSLEVLSVSTPIGQAQITLDRVSAAFLGDSGHPEGEGQIKAPRLRELALTRVEIRISSVPKLATLVRLKLVGCTIASSALLLGLLNRARRNLETLCLQDLAKVHWPLLPEEKLPSVEFQSLISLTLITSRVLATEVLPRLTSTTLVKLTCDDTFLQCLDPHRFPTLSHLYVRSLQSSSVKTYQKMLKKFNIASLTIFRDPSARCGLNVLLWSMSLDPDLGKSLRRLKYVTKEKALVQGLLDMLNRGRHKSLSMPKNTVFASQEVIYEHRDEYELPWGECRRLLNLPPH